MEFVRTKNARERRGRLLHCVRKDGKTRSRNTQGRISNMSSRAKRGDLRPQWWIDGFMYCLGVKPIQTAASVLQTAEFAGFTGQKKSSTVK